LMNWASSSFVGRVPGYFGFAFKLVPIQDV
jgi:hypothetical protein